MEKCVAKLVLVCVAKPVVYCLGCVFLPVLDHTGMNEYKFVSFCFHLQMV